MSLGARLSADEEIASTRRSRADEVTRVSVCVLFFVRSPLCPFFLSFPGFAFSPFRRRRIVVS